MSTRADAPSARKSPAAKRAVAEAAARRLRTPPASTPGPGDDEAVTLGRAASSGKTRPPSGKRRDDQRVDLSTVVGISRAALSGLVGSVAGQVKARVPEAAGQDPPGLGRGAVGVECGRLREPLPAKITIEVLEPIHVGERFGYKAPRDVEFIAQLPRNATGKIVKSELQETGTPKAQTPTPR